MVNPSDPPWFRPRGYLHFDVPIAKKRAVSIATDPAQVAAHAFYPLLSYTISAVKARRDASRRTITKVRKDRPIRYAAHVDAHIFSYYAHVIGAKYEQELQARGLGDCVLAFRKLEASNIDFAAHAFEVVRGLGDCTVLAFDVTGFFDNIDHALLKRIWARTLGGTTLPADHYALYRALTRYSHVDRDKVYAALGVSAHNPKNGRRRICSPEEFRGLVRDGGLIEINQDKFVIPQGTPISALLSNVYLLDFDTAMQTEVKSRGGTYLRYCDDILIAVPAGKDAGLEAHVIDQLKALELDANPKKTEKSNFVFSGKVPSCDRPLQYLGFLFDGQRVLIRSAALAKFSGRMNQGVRLAKATAKSRNADRAAFGLPAKAMYKRKLYERYSHLGHRNFIRYGFRAAKTLKSEAIRRQLRPLWGRLKAAIEKP